MKEETVERLERIETKIDSLVAGHGALRVEVAAGLADLRGRVRVLEDARRNGMSFAASVFIVVLASALNFFLGYLLA